MAESAAAWLIDNTDLWPRRGRVLDVACGRGRNALALAAAGLDVHAIDRNEEAIAELRDLAARSSLSIDAQVLDLETDPPALLPASAYDAIVVFNYLHRPLMPMLRAALKPGGCLFYETFTVRQAERGHPRNPSFLLRDGELLELVAPFAILRSREGDIDGRWIASVVAART